MALSRGFCIITMIGALARFNTVSYMRFIDGAWGRRRHYFFMGAFAG